MGNTFKVSIIVRLLPIFSYIDLFLHSRPLN